MPSFCVFTGYFDIAKLLVRHGADINAESIDKETALTYAAQKSLVLILIEVSNGISLF